MLTLSAGVQSPFQSPALAPELEADPQDPRKYGRYDPDAPSGQSTLHYGGGKLLANVEVLLFFWGKYWSDQGGGGPSEVTKFVFFLQNFLVSNNFAMVREYSVRRYVIGPGRLANFATSADDPPAQVSDVDGNSDVLALLSALAVAPGFEPNANSLYCIILPPGVGVSAPFVGDLCDDWCAYHNDRSVLTIASPIFRTRVPYAMIPYLGCAPCNRHSSINSSFSQMTAALTHEIVESVTDPFSDGWTFPIDPQNPMAPAEIGDRCAGYWQEEYVDYGGPFGTFVVQSEWSNSQIDCTYGPNFGLWQIAIATNTVGPRHLHGALEIFGINGQHQTAIHRWQLVRNGNWSPWATLGGEGLRQIVVASNDDGRLEIFALRWDLSAAHCFQLPIIPMKLDHDGEYGTWKAFTTWESLGGVVLQQLAAGRDSLGRLVMLALGADRVVYLRRQYTRNGPWADWTKLNGCPPGAQIVAFSDMGVLEVFVIDIIGILWFTTQADDGAAGWSLLGPLPGFTQVAPAMNASGGREIFALGPNGVIWGDPGGLGLWIPWNGTHDVQQLVTANNLDGSLELFALGGDGNVYLFRQDGGLGWDWLNPLFLGGNNFGQIVVGRNDDGRLELIAIDQVGGSFHCWQTAPDMDNWTGWASWR